MIALLVIPAMLLALHAAARFLQPMDPHPRRTR